MLEARLPELFEVEPGVADRGALLGAFGPLGGAARRRGPLRPLDAGAAARSSAPGASAFAARLPPGGPAVRRLDVTLLGAAIERSPGSMPPRSPGGGSDRLFDGCRRGDRVGRRRGPDGADAAFLLDPTPAAEIVAVAADGDVMPQKSTYIYPKALTGLVINPLE